MDRRTFIGATSSVIATASFGLGAAVDVAYPERVWQGMTATITGAAIDPDEVYTLRRVTAVDGTEVTDSLLVEETRVDSDGTVTIETETLSSGDYFLRGEGLPDIPSIRETFEIVDQDLIVTFDRDIVEPGRTADIRIDSDRFRFPVDVSSPDFDEETIQGILTASSDVELADSQPDEPGTVRLDELSVGRLTATFDSGLPFGNYTFEFDVVDTTASASASIGVGDPEPLFSDAFAWQGDLIVAESEYMDPGETYDLRRVDSIDSGTVGASTLVREVGVTDDGRIEIDTSDLDVGSYFIRGGPFLPQPPTEKTFEVSVQELVAEFSGRQIGASETRTVTIDSNRGRYVVRVSADGDLSAGVLTDIFVNSGGFTLVDSDPNSIEISVTSSQSADIDVSDVPTGTYTFTFDVVDTAARDSASIAIGDAARPPGVDQDVFEAVADEDGELGVIELSQAIAEVQNGNPVNGAEVSVIDLSQLINWVSSA